MAKNERETENFVRDELRALQYFHPDANIRVEEQKSNIEAVKRLLRTGSKSGAGGFGSPEFIISATDTPDFLMVVECKADTKDHQSGHAYMGVLSPAGDVADIGDYAKRAQRYAVDGVLHYARALSKEFNVIAVAVSGGAKSSKLFSVFLHPKGGDKASPLLSKTGAAIEAFLPWPDLIEHATFDPTVQKVKFDELMAFSRELHEFMRDHAKLTESQKPLLVSGTLIALRNAAFSKAYDAHTPDELQKEWMRVIRGEIEKANIPQGKKDNMAQPYSGIAVHPVLGKASVAYPRGVLHELITRLREKVWPFIEVYRDFDVVGQFYGEFLKYTGGDKKALGIVLTPRHITELFSLIANVDRSSTVIDICAGTSGFLVSAMHQMMRSAQTKAEVERIKKQGLVGVEQQPDMFALAASNMILRGDGKANLYQGSCFDKAITKAIVAHKANVGLLNPPFSQSDADQHELHFVKHMLDCLAPGGTGVAIVPMSCAISPHPLKLDLLKNHTLEAVMSMPDDLFYPVGTVTCIMVFTAHQPHAKSDRKTWFGFWKRDGFVKEKHKGRVDLYNRWSEIRANWIEAYRNREVHVGFSVSKKVGANDEWCAEAYMQTDYSTLDRQHYEENVKRFLVFQLLHGMQPANGADNEEDAL
ncbi:SAM-dependent DNA methyltransferase [Variovorax gossypii]|uniref:site-specific DNA-methyltransferase (adenine-specific) n=1 Tax=Variovorax gossypii TaxID=1679495 RepID=A0A3S0J5M7_9BURK|nr:N-6 DNA methylase [Variovorax gossypii]RTQ34343.1 SAM-dependent DNA methyltransferase [Variovorax gossypii]